MSSVRETAVFAVQNVCMHPPFTRLDAISCRNLLIYLSPETQKKLLPVFHYSLTPGGLLLLGSAESVGARTDLFAPVDDKVRLYRRLDADQSAERVAFPATVVPQAPASRTVAAPRPPADLATLAERVLLERFAPAAVMVDRDGAIQYVSGHTGAYLEPAPGAANWNLLAMAREGLRHELTRAFSVALRGDGPVRLSNLMIDTGTGVLATDVTLQMLQEPAALRGMLVVTFEPVPAAAPDPKAAPKRRRGARSPRLAERERQLQQSRREMEEMREAMQASVEGFGATNEELQSTNEELQSTNEELTTSREEMQSMNEELETLNRELRARVDDLSRTNSDVRNLLDSAEDAVLFLDAGLRLRLFTAGATRLFRLIPGDVGRRITDIANDLVLPELETHLQRVLQTLAHHEQEVSTRDGRHFALRIRPYRTLDNVIDGLVVTLADVTAAKQLEAELRRVQADLERRLDASERDPRREAREDDA
jgi:two-component system CheB/CheR fusion protein